MSEQYTRPIARFEPSDERLVRRLPPTPPVHYRIAHWFTSMAIIATCVAVTALDAWILYLIGSHW